MFLGLFAGFMKWVWNWSLSSSIFFEDFDKYWCYFFFIYLVPMTSSNIGLFFWGEVFGYWFYILTMDLYLFLQDSVLVSRVSRDLSISSRLSNILGHNYLKYCLITFFIFVASVLMTPLFSLSLVISVFFLNLSIF